IYPAWSFAGLEISLFIENIVGRQQHFMCYGQELAVFIKHRRIVVWLSAPLGKGNRSEDDPDTFSRVCQPLPVTNAGGDKAVLVEKVAWRISHDGQFRENDKLG